MNIEDVNEAMVNDRTVIHEYNGYLSPYKISGVITRYDEKRGWWYSLELRDLKANSITVAKIEDVSVSKEDNF